MTTPVENAPETPESYVAGGPLARLRALLAAEFQAQVQEAVNNEATVAALTGQLDVDSVLERELAEAAARRAVEAMANIERALARIDSGTYGSCEACGAEIPYARLEAIPYAQLCVRCSAPRGRLLN